MAEHKKPSRDPSDGNAPEGSKKPYKSPRVLFREPLEALAAVCTPPPVGVGKAPGGPLCQIAQT
jgi:hypothetical protein